MGRVDNLLGGGGLAPDPDTEFCLAGLGRADTEFWRFGRLGFLGPLGFFYGTSAKLGYSYQKGARGSYVDPGERCTTLENTEVRIFIYKRTSGNVRAVPLSEAPILDRTSMRKQRSSERQKG